MTHFTVPTLACALAAAFCLAQVPPTPSDPLDDPGDVASQGQSPGHQPGRTTLVGDGTGLGRDADNRAWYVLADIELSPGMIDGPLTRCICFDLYDCQSYPVTVCQEVTFIAGLAVDVEVPAGGRVFECMEAKDPLHTLRSIAQVTFDGDGYTAAFTGNPASGGNWLVGGNLNDDVNIDILDVGIYEHAVANNTVFSTGDTTCSTQRTHADVNGDGLVSAADFEIIAVDNWLSARKAGCWQLECDCLDPDVDSDGDTIPDCIDVCPGIDDTIFAPGCEGAIPTVSEWGLLILALLLMVAAKIRFARGNPARG